MSLADIKAQILAQTDIVELIGQNLRIQRRGANYVALCPFHEEKTPSFTISPQKQIYKCFGCGKNGNAITFVMEYNGLNFIEALKYLANRAGIPFEFEQKDESDQNKYNEMYRANELATNFFADALFSSEGKRCLDYFHSRGFDNDTIDKFRLGYAPDAFDKLLKFLEKNGVSRELALEVGLLAQNENQKTFDRFRNRAIFPITNIFGNTIAFGARLLSNDKNQAKYINSPQTPLYDKSKILFGLHQAKQSILQSNKAILTEGYADVITMHQFGFTNTISTSGTALTEYQLQLLSRYTKNLLILYDGDSAGINASLRALAIALKKGFEVELVLLPNGNDPDSFLREFGRTELLKLLENQDNSFLNYLIKVFFKNKNLTPSARAEVVSQILEIIANIPDQFHQTLLVQELASKLGFDNIQLKTLQNKLLKLQQNTFVPEIRELEQNKPNSQASNTTFEEECKRLIGELTRSEFALLSFALENNDNFDLFRKNDQIEKFLLSQVARRLFVILRGFNTLDELTSKWDDPEFNSYVRNILITISLEVPKTSDSWRKYSNSEIKNDRKTKFRTILLNLEKDFLEKKIEEIMEEIKTTKDQIEKISFMETFKRNKTRLEEIKNIIASI